MAFNSIQFIIFLPIVVLLYYVIPKKVRYIWLLLASYFFYMCWNAKYAVLILTSTLITYFCALGVEKFEEVSKKKLFVVLGLVSNLGIFFFFKYTNFAIEIISKVFMKAHVELNLPTVDVLLPVGISFYTFQALGYMIDVYRGECKAERNFLRYALFVSFFPQLVAGPIERSKNLLSQLKEDRRFDFEKARDGVLLILWGFFLKLVLADRMAMFVDGVYGDLQTFGGWYVVIATVLFGLQIYCDFYGYSMIATGSAKLLGIDLMENFNAPYFSTSVGDFWRRWHISLTSWFKDYLYVPLGGSRKGTFRKYLNKMIVFLVSGLWHGASFAYVFWGGLNGLYQVVGEILTPFRKKVRAVLHFDETTLGYKLVAGLLTFVMVDFSWLFFRAGSLSVAKEALTQMFTVKNPWILTDMTLYGCGLDQRNFILLMACILVLVVADICKVKGVAIREVITKQDPVIRWILIAFFVTFIMIFGIYGPQYEAANFVYFQF